MITDGCINCGHCAHECPYQAIYEACMMWSLNEGTKLKGKILMQNGRQVMADETLDPLSEKYYFIVPDKCTECKDINEIPKCLTVCPNPECIVIDPLRKESEEMLRSKNTRLSQGIYERKFLMGR